MSKTYLPRPVKKVLLVRPDLLGTPYAISNLGVRHQPMGLFYMAAPLVKAGFDVRYCDEILRDDLESMLKDFRPDFVGVSSASPLFMRAKKLVALAKQFGALTAMGGPHITALPEDALVESRADFVVVGESEHVLPRVLAGEAFEDLDGVGFWRDGEPVIRPRTDFISDLDGLPFPAREIADMDRYRMDTEFGFHIHPKARMMRIITSRGCAYQCTFCARHKTFGRNTRKRSAESVVSEMDYLHKTYGARHFTLLDDTFTEDPRHVRAICEELLKKDRDYIWCSYSRVDNDLQLLNLMHRAGCRMLEFGVETGSQKVLDAIKKNITVDDVIHGFEAAKRAGFKTKAFFMVGLPGEEDEDFLQSVRLAKRINPHYLWLSIFLPLPGSEIYENLTTEDKVDFSRESFFQTNSRELNLKHRKFLLQFYSQPRYIKQFLSSLTWSETLYFMHTAWNFTRLTLFGTAKT